MSFLSNLRIRTRLIGAFAITALITLVIGLMGMNSTSTLSDMMSDMYANQLTPIKDVSNANMQAIYMNRSLYDYVIETDKAGMDKIKTQIDGYYKQYNQLFDKYQATDLSEPEKVLIGKLKAAWPAYLVASEKVMKHSYADQNKEALELMNGDASKSFQVVDDVLSELVELNAKLAHEADDLGNAKTASARNLAIGSIVVAVVLSGILAMSITSSITAPLAQAVSVAEAVAAGDLTVAVDPKGTDELAQLLGSMRDMKDSLVKVVGNVRSGSEGVATASAEIAQGNNDLSARTEQQASSLEETAASMEELSSTVRQNADSARQANQLAASASTVAVKGGEVVGEVVETMKGINDASRKISDIISVIDGIAFQTNILALNAAVEAARAGEQGRGFAVVASEVRSLAGRSAEAAKEIKVLINASVERVELGTSLVDKAGETMTEVVNSIRRVTDLMGEISAASNEQAQGVAQVGEAVTQMDQVTQQNAALVEEMAAAASSLQTQARDLVQVVSVFKMAGGMEMHAPHRTATRAAPAKPYPAMSDRRLPSPGAAPRAAPKAKSTMAQRPIATAAPKLTARAAPKAAAGGSDDDSWETF